MSIQPRGTLFVYVLSVVIMASRTYKVLNQDQATQLFSSLHLVTPLTIRVPTAVIVRRMALVSGIPIVQVSLGMTVQIEGMVQTFLTLGKQKFITMSFV